MSDVDGENLTGPHNRTVSVVGLTEPSPEADKRLVNYLEHVSFCEGLVLLLDVFAVLSLTLIFTQALALSKDLVTKRSSRLRCRGVSLNWKGPTPNWKGAMLS